MYVPFPWMVYSKHTRTLLCLTELIQYAEDYVMNDLILLHWILFDCE